MLDESIAKLTGRLGDGRGELYSYLSESQTVRAEKAFTIGEALNVSGESWIGGTLALHAAGYFSEFYSILGSFADSEPYSVAQIVYGAPAISSGGSGRIPMPSSPGTESAAEAIAKSYCTAFQARLGASTTILRSERTRMPYEFRLAAQLCEAATPDFGDDSMTFDKLEAGALGIINAVWLPKRDKATRAIGQTLRFATPLGTEQDHLSQLQVKPSKTMERRIDKELKALNAQDRRRTDEG